MMKPIVLIGIIVAIFLVRDVVRAARWQRNRWKPPVVADPQPPRDGPWGPRP